MVVVVSKELHPLDFVGALESVIAFYWQGTDFFWVWQVWL